MKLMSKRIIVAILLSGTIGVGARAFYASRESDAPAVTTALVTRGPVAEVVAATGTLQAVTTVQVGTQVSGTISWLGADFNSIVHKGQVIAKLDPALIQTQVDQARANLTKASADVQSAQVNVTDAQQKYSRAQGLSAKQLIAQSDLDAAKVTADTAQAQLRSVQAQVVQAQAGLNQAELNLTHTVITTPIDGIVIGRSVDVGQTVAASLSSPTVFSIAADLSQMQVSASIDESDIGRIRPQQQVTFKVDAYPTDQFTGTVTQIRLQPSVVQNVTTYNVIVSVPNTALKLKPGMTANVNIEVAARADVVRVPNAALRFRPTAAIFTALGQTAPTNPTTGNAETAIRVRSGQAEKPLSASPATSAGPASNVVSAARVAGDSRATTIDALFAPLTQAETPGRVWIIADNRLESVPVTLGLTDGKTTEVIKGDVQPGATVVTNITTGANATTATATAVKSPFTTGGGGFGGPGGRQGPRP
jgi:HlyD family secretion protein